MEEKPKPAPVKFRKPQPLVGRLPVVHFPTLLAELGKRHKEPRKAFDLAVAKGEGLLSEAKERHAAKLAHEAAATSSSGEAKRKK